MKLKEEFYKTNLNIEQGRSQRFSLLRSCLPVLVLILCLLQPVLDVIGFWQERLKIGNSLTMIVRMLLLGGTVIIGFLLSNRKKYYLIAAIVMLVLTGFHIIACLKNPNGYQGAVLDVLNLVRIYFLPMMTLCFITFLRQNEKTYHSLMIGMLVNVLTIAAVQLISTITGTDPHTYPVDNLGTLGWFMWTNSQSAILGMLSPVLICWTIRHYKGKILPVVMISVISFATLYFLAPRLSYASLIGTGLGVFACVMLFRRVYWKQGLAVLLITILFVFPGYWFSPAKKRIAANETRTNVAREDIEDVLKKTVVPKKEHSFADYIPPSGFSDETDTEPETTELMESTEETVSDTEETAELITSSNSDENEGKDETSDDKDKEKVVLSQKELNDLEDLYKSRLNWAIMDRFGRDKVFEVYNYTLDPDDLGSNRMLKINFCRLLMDESGTLSKMFGLNLNEMSTTREDKDGKKVKDNYDVENDFHGVYFLTGWVGLGLMLLFLLYFGLRAVLSVIRNPKEKLNLTMAGFFMAYGIGLIHAYYTASVLRRNNASFYLAIILACLYYVSERKTEENI